MEEHPSSRVLGHLALCRDDGKLSDLAGTLLFQTGWTLLSSLSSVPSAPGKHAFREVGDLLEGFYSLASLVEANSHNMTAKSVLPDSQSLGHVEQRDAKLKSHPAPPTPSLTWECVA